MAKILIVDDENSICLTLSEFLKREGHNVQTIGDAKQAVKIINNEQFDIIIADIIMPELTGIDILNMIREISKRTQVIMMTGEPTIDSATHSLRKGAYDYVVKPIRKDSIIKIVNSASQVVALYDEKKRLEDENIKYQKYLEEIVDARTKELKDSYKRLENIQMKLLAILKSTTHGLCMLNTAWKIEIANHSMHSMLNPLYESTEDLIGFPLKTFFESEEEFIKFKNSVIEDIKMKGAAINEVKLKRFDGSLFWGEISVVRHNPFETNPGFVATLTDITDRREKENLLKFRLELQRIISSISTDFVNLNIYEINNLFNKALEKICIFSNSDRGIVYLFNDKELNGEVKYEWFKNGTASVKSILQNIFSYKLSWFKNKIRNIEVVSIPDTNQLPDEAAEEKDCFRSLNIKSSLNIPIHYGKILKGFIGIAITGKTKQWEQDVIYLLQIIADILANALEHLEIEEKIHKREAQYRAIVEDQTELIYRFLPTGEVTFVNQAFCSYFNIRRDELLGKKFSPVIYIEDVDKFKNLTSSINRENAVRTEEFRIIKPDGMICWNQWSIRAIYDKQGSCIELQSVGRDINELKKAEDLLRKSRDKIQKIQMQYHAVLKTTPNGLCIVTPNWVISYLNLSMCKMLDPQTDKTIDLIDMPFSILFKDQALFKNYTNESINNIRSKGIDIREIQIRRFDGSLFWSEVSIVRIDPSETASGYVVTITDISERKLIEKQNNLLAATGQQLSVITTPKEAAQVIMSIADELIGWEACSFGLLSNDEQNLKIVLSMDSQGGMKREILSKNVEYVLTPTDKKIILGGAQLIHSGEKSSLSQLNIPSFINKSNLPNYCMLVPISRGENILGIFTIMSFTKYTYTQRDLQLFQPLVNQCSGALERIQAESSLRESEERYALSAKGANDGLWDWDILNNKIYFSSRWKSMLGYSDNEIGDNPDDWFNLVHDEDKESLKIHIASHVEGYSDFFQDEYRIKHKDGSYRWMLGRGLAIKDKTGVSYRMAGSQTDITERKIAEEQLLHDAFHDALTGLPNRALFLDRLGHKIEKLKRTPDYFFAVLFLDVDRFKNINDSKGHLVGDQLLKQIAKRLERCLRPTDSIARLGGDEFTILLEDIKDPNISLKIAQRIHQDFIKPFSIGDIELTVTVSIGIALSNPGYGKPDEILRDADTAMYQAKSLGRAGHVVFDEDMHNKIVNALEMEIYLRKAIEREEFIVYYQPIISLSSNIIKGFEALIRWNHPERKMVLPVEFIPLAEETGLIIPMSRYILKHSCSKIQEWTEKYSPQNPYYISVNISGRWFNQEDLAEQIYKILQEINFNPKFLLLEITESTIMENAERTNDILSQLKKFNMQISIDDFGTGYSSLSYLHRFPLDILKIDRSFITRMLIDNESLEIVKTIINLAKNLKMKTVAEGIENITQLEYLKNLQCDLAQGYYFSKPESAEVIEGILKSNKKLP